MHTVRREVITMVRGRGNSVGEEQGGKGSVGTGLGHEVGNLKAKRLRKPKSRV